MNEMKGYRLNGIQLCVHLLIKSQQIALMNHFTNYRPLFCHLNETLIDNTRTHTVTTSDQSNFIVCVIFLNDI